MRWNIALFGLVLVLLFSSSASSTGSISLPFTLQSGLAARLGIVLAAPGASFRQQSEGDNILWRNNLYEVRLTPRFHNGITYLTLHVKSIARDSLAITSLSLQVLAPSSG